MENIQLSVGSTIKAFGLSAATVHRLEKDGRLCYRGRGIITAKWLRMLDKVMRQDGRYYPLEALDIVAKYAGKK